MIVKVNSFYSLILTSGTSGVTTAIFLPPRPRLAGALTVSSGITSSSPFSSASSSSDLDSSTGASTFLFPFFLGSTTFFAADFGFSSFAGAAFLPLPVFLVSVSSSRSSGANLIISFRVRVPRFGAISSAG